MKNVRNIILCSIVVCSIPSTSYGLGEHLGEKLGKSIEEASENISNTAIDATEMASKTLAEAAPTIGIAAAQVIGEAGAEISKNMAEVTQSIVNNITPFVHAYLGYVVTKDVATIGKDFI